MLSDIGTGILIALLLFTGLVAAFAIYWLWLYLKTTLMDPYTEGRIGYYRIFHFENRFSWRTLGGFRIIYELRGMLERVDNEKFIEAQMLDEKNRSLLVEHFNQAAVIRHFQPAGAWFFVYGWANDCEPYVFAYKAVDRDGEVTLDLDPNQVDLKYAVKEWIQEKSWHCDGCVVDLLLINIVMSPQLIEVNYNMLTPEQLASVERDKRYLLAEEAAVVAALKRRLDLIEPSDVHKNGTLLIRWSIVGQVVRIGWEIDEKAHREGFGVRGFRREGAFCYNKYSQTENGDLIVDSAVNDSTTDHPHAESTQFYSFMLTRPLKDGKVDCRDSVRFQLRIPQESDVAALRQSLEKTRSAITALHAPRPVDDRMRKLMASIDFGVETATALVSAKRRRVETVKSREDLAPEEKELIIEEIERRFEAAHMQIDRY